MSWGRKSKRITFDLDEAVKVIYGESDNRSLSSFLGRKDLRKGTEEKIETEIREAESHNSFGEIRKIDF